MYIHKEQDDGRRVRDGGGGLGGSFLKIRPSFPGVQCLGVCLPMQGHGSIPGLGRPHEWGSLACGPQLLGPCTYSLCSIAREATVIKAPPTKGSLAGETPDDRDPK